jgi:hypothetical protein
MRCITNSFFNYLTRSYKEYAYKLCDNESKDNAHVLLILACIDYTNINIYIVIIVDV